MNDAVKFTIIGIVALPFLPILAILLLAVMIGQIIHGEYRDFKWKRANAALIKASKR